MSPEDDPDERDKGDDDQPPAEGEPPKEDRPPRDEPEREPQDRGEPRGREEHEPRGGEQREPPREDYREPPRDQRRGGGVDVPTEALGDPVVQDELKYVVGFHAIVGVGIGLATLLGVALGTGSSFGPGGASAGSKATVKGAGVVVALVGPLLLGPILAVGIDERLEGEPSEKYLAGGVANAAGGFVFALIAGLLAISSGPGGGNFGDFILPIIVIALVTGIVSAAILWFREFLRVPV